jgi:hypothetical protein
MAEHMRSMDASLLELIDTYHEHKLITLEDQQDAKARKQVTAEQRNAWAAERTELLTQLYNFLIGEGVKINYKEHVHLNSENTKGINQYLNRWRKSKLTRAEKKSGHVLMDHWKFPEDKKDPHKGTFLDASEQEIPFSVGVIIRHYDGHVATAMTSIYNQNPSHATPASIKMTIAMAINYAVETGVHVDEDVLYHYFGDNLYKL